MLGTATARLPTSTNTVRATNCWAGTAVASAMTAAPERVRTRFFGFTEPRRKAIVNARRGVIVSMPAIHVGTAGSSPGRGRPSHFRTARTTSAAPSRIFRWGAHRKPPPAAPETSASRSTTAPTEKRPSSQPETNARESASGRLVTSTRAITTTGDVASIRARATGSTSPMAVSTGSPRDRTPRDVPRRDSDRSRGVHLRSARTRRAVGS